MFERALDCFADDIDARSVEGVRPAALADLLATLPADQAAYLRGCGFRAEAGEVALLPGDEGVAGAVLGLGEAEGPAIWGALPSALPAGTWRLGERVPDPALAALGWAMGAYRFDRLRRPKAGDRATLVSPAGFDASAARAMWLARDLINMPANLLGPAELAAISCESLSRRGAHAEVIAGADLARGFPAMHAVGAGSARPPALARADWHGSTAAGAAPLISICGKGVCFDSGGYDIKPSAAMLRMKKDMGGAAIALGLACMIMDADLPVRLELRLGCVENMISGMAMRPGDVIATRAGLAVEVGNTDAEGRLVLCDLLADACEHMPAMLLDFATLTGAARTALGPDIPALFTNDDDLASLFTQAGTAAHDPVWRLPLWDGYNSWLETGAGDLNNVSEKAHAGAILASLFLQRFVSAETRWAHFDVYAWNDTSRPGRPAGGEAQAMRAVFQGVARFAAGGLSNAEPE